MKLKSVKDLYLVKRLVFKCPDKEYRDKTIQLINGVLLAESGSKAVLYPYNDLKEEIIELFGQCMNPKEIAAKLGLEGDGEGVVLCVVEDQSNYPEEDGC